MDHWKNLVLAVVVLHLILIVQVIESNRRPPLRPPPWRNQMPLQHQGRGGMPIPIHDNNLAQRRIYNGPPPPGPNKFPPMRNKLPPPGYFNKQRRPPPPYGGFNQPMRPPPPPNSPSQPHQFKYPPSSHSVLPNFHPQGHSEQTISITTPPPTSAPYPSPPPPPPPTHHQYNQQQQPVQPSIQQFHQFQHQQQSQYPIPHSAQYPNVTSTPLIVGSIQASQQTAYSNQHLSVVKPDTPKTQPASQPQSQQIYQFHIPPQNNNQPNSIIQIHLSSTTESPKDGAGKDYFTGSTYKTQNFNSGSVYPNSEYLPYEKPKTTPQPSLNFKEMNSDKYGVYERPVIYKTSNSKEREDRPYAKLPYSSVSGHGKPIDFTTESSYNRGDYPQRPGPQSKVDNQQQSFLDSNSKSQYRQEFNESPQQGSYSKSDYEHSLSPPSKHDFGLNPPKQEYGLTPLAKVDYEQYKNYKEYANKYSQLDPLYHPDGEGKSSNEEDAEAELSLPERYDNSFSTNYKHDDSQFRDSQDFNPETPPRTRQRGGSKKQPPEEILSALGLSTNPLDHADIVKTVNEKLYKKEPLYSMPDRQIEEDDEEVNVESSGQTEVGYPGTSYNMPEKSASRIHHVKRPPPEVITSKIKGLKPPALSSHIPDHRDDIITAETSNEYYAPNIDHREDTASSYGRYPDPPRPPPKYSPPPNYAYGQHDYAHQVQAPFHGPGGGPPPLHYGPSAAPPPPYHGPTGPSPYGHHGHPIYVTEPDPIIEIIVQDSNVTLPPPPKPKPTVPIPVTPEPVHVFYVRYSNTNNKTIIGSGSENQNLRLDPPIQSLSVKSSGLPQQHNQHQQFNNFQQYQQPQPAHSQPQVHYVPPVGSHYNGQQLTTHYQQQAKQTPGSHYITSSTVNNQQHQQPQTSGGHFAPPQLPPPLESSFPPTTTMRAIIRLDKNEYESNHLKVAFDHSSNPFSHLQHQQQSQQQQPAASQQYAQIVQVNHQQNTQPIHPQNTQMNHPQNTQMNHPQNTQSQQQQSEASQQYPQMVQSKHPLNTQLQQSQQAEASQQYPQMFQPNQQQNTQVQLQQQFQSQQQFQPITTQQQQFQSHNSPPQQEFQLHQSSSTQQQIVSQHPQPQQFMTQSQPQSQFSSQLNQQFQTLPAQFHQHSQQFLNQIPQQSQQVTQYQQPPGNVQFQRQHQSQETQQSQNMHQYQIPQQQLQGHQQQHPGHDADTLSSQQVAQFQIPQLDSQSQSDSQQQHSDPPTLSPSDQDFNMDPIWTNWNHQQQQQQQQQIEQDQQPAQSTNLNHQVVTHSIQPAPPPQTSSGGYNPMLNYGGGEPLGLSGLHTIGTENNMKFDNPVGLRPPPGPIYPKLGGFQKRIGLDDLATLLGEESAQQTPQQQSNQHQQGQVQHSQQHQPSPSISATYHDPDQEHHQHNQQQSHAQQQQYADQQEKLSKLPDDVPEELRQQLIDSGILGNAEVQVINYDQNMFKDLTNLPAEAIESFQQSDDISKLLASSVATNRPVRSILVINESSPSLRPKRKGKSKKLLLFIEDQNTLIYDVKKQKVMSVENKFIQNAIHYTHHKN